MWISVSLITDLTSEFLAQFLIGEFHFVFRFFFSLTYGLSGSHFKRSLSVSWVLMIYPRGERKNGYEKIRCPRRELNR